VGEIFIDGLTYRNDLLILGSIVRPNWRRRQGNPLSSEDTKLIVGATPAILLVGCGASGLMKASERGCYCGKTTSSGKSQILIRTFIDIMNYRRRIQTLPPFYILPAEGCPFRFARSAVGISPLKRWRQENNIPARQRPAL